MIRNSDIQFHAPAEIRAFQEERMRETIAYVAEHSAYYRALFAETGIDPRDIRTLDDLRQLPPATKCVPRRRIVDYVTTSGTLGDPVTFALTESDLDRLAYNEMLSFTTAGCTPDDILQLMVTLDRRFMAGLAYFLGARKLGCGVTRVGNGIPELQWDICIGEGLRTPDGFELSTLATQIHERWPELELFSTYASTEMQTSFTECPHHCGGHLPPDLIVVEFLDDGGQPVADDEPGEVTITTLGVEGMPLVRFRTGDVCYHHIEPCPCGRNTVRLGSLLGRKGQMIKFKGTTLYPPALFDILDNIPDVKNYIVEVFTNSLGTDQVQIRVGSDVRSEEFVKQIKDIFRSKVRVAPDILFEPAERIARDQFPAMSRKPVKFIDLRKNTLH